MKYVIFGAGSHGKVVYSILKRNFVDSEDILFADVFSKKFDNFLDCRVIGGLDDRLEIPTAKYSTILAFAGDPRGGNKLRQNLSQKILTTMESPQYDGHATIIDPSTIIASGVKIGSNISIGYNSILNIDSEIGNGVIVNNDVLIEHDVKVGEYTNLSPSVKIMGNVKIGERVFIGAGSILRNNLTIGSDSIIGMGSIVTKDLPSKSLLIGNSNNVTSTE